MIETTQKLQPLGWVLSPAASALYLNLLDDAVLDGRGDAAAELLTAGFALLDPVTNLLVALPPEVPIVRSLASMTHLWLSQRPDIAAVERDLIALARRDKRVVQMGSPTHLVEEFTDRERRGVALNSAITSARSELSSMQPDQSPEPGSEDPEQLAFAPDDLLRRGVAIRFLYERSVLDSEAFLSAALEEVDMGVQARVTTSLPSDAILIDRTALLVLNCDERSTALYTTAPPMVATFLSTFDSLWTTAVPIGVSNLAGGDDGLSELHKIVLSNVLAGRPNDAIGRALKLHPRTVRRKVDDLCDAFGVDNRAALMSAALARLRD